MIYQDSSSTLNDLGRSLALLLAVQDGSEWGQLTLYGSLEERFARFARRHAIVIPRGDVPTHQAEPLGHGIQHVFAPPRGVICVLIMAVTGHPFPSRQWSCALKFLGRPAGTGIGRTAWTMLG